MTSYYPPTARLETAADVFYSAIESPTRLKESVLSANWDSKNSSFPLFKAINRFTIENLQGKSSILPNKAKSHYDSDSRDNLRNHPDRSIKLISPPNYVPSYKSTTSNTQSNNGSPIKLIRERISPNHSFNVSSVSDLSSLTRGDTIYATANKDSSFQRPERMPNDYHDNSSNNFEEENLMTDLIETYEMESTEESYKCGKNEYMLQSPLTVYSMSPLASVSFSPIESTSNLDYKRARVIDELLATEEAYISSLHMLSRLYIEPVIDRTMRRCGVPILLIDKYTKLLIAHHEEFLFIMRKLASQQKYKDMTSSSASPIDSSNGSTTNVSSSALLAARLSRIVSGRAIDKELYQNYCAIHENVLTLVKKTDNKIFGSIDKRWTKGCETYLETAHRNRMDLSFISLVQNPVSRMSRYKLILEAIFKYTADEPIFNGFVRESLERIKEDLTSINETYKIMKASDNTPKIITRFVLNEPMDVPFEYFGQVVLVGLITCIWMKTFPQIFTQTMASFLFNSHIIFAKFEKNDCFDIQYIIPLETCKIIDNDEEYESGLTTYYQKAFKLVFEKDFCIFELLLIFFSENECEIWKKKILSCFSLDERVYKFDYSASLTNLTHPFQSLVPSNMSPKETNINLSNPQTLANCYFSSFQLVTIVHVEDSCSKSYDVNRTSKLQYDENNSTVHLSDSYRIGLENKLRNFYSQELLSSRLSTNAPGLVKSSSWPSLKLNSLRSFRSSFRPESPKSDSEETFPQNIPIEGNSQGIPEPDKSNSNSEQEPMNQSEESSKLSFEIKRNNSTGGSLLRKLFGGIFFRYPRKRQI